ncbi:MAG: PAS domain S-box protein [Deltaproteobacteria bacterium]|nr:PAS domain S-box protein [Deltaproteobacteria bacterium]
MAQKPTYEELEQKISKLKKETVDHKLMEDALYDSQHMLNTVLDSIPSAVFWKDRNLFYLGGNRTWLNTVGMNSSEEVIGKNDYELSYTKEQADSFRKHDKKVMESGIPEYDIIEPYLKADGTQAWAKTNKVPLRNTDGNIIGLLGSYKNITKRKKAEEELQKQRNLFKMILETTPDMLIFKDTNSVYRAVNSSFCKYVGKSMEKIIGKTDYDLFPAHEAEMYRQDDAKVMKSLKPLIQDEQATLMQGKQWFHVAKTPVFDNNKKLIGILCSNRDITKRKKIQSDLLANEEKYRKLFEEARDGIVLADAETGIIVDCNSEIAKLVERKKSELLGQHQSILHPQLAIVDGFSDSFIKHRNKFDGQILDEHVVTSTGEIKDVAVKSTIIELDNKKYLQGIFRDITEEKKAKEALIKSEKLYRTLVENIDMGVTLIDTNHNIILTNTGQEKMFNKKAKEFIGKKCFQEFEKRDGVCPHCPGVIAMNTGQTAEVETAGLKDDGSKFDVRICAFPIFGTNNTVTGFIKIVEDITVKKKLEAQFQKAQKFESIGTLAGGIAHDFNNLLMSIQGNTSLMLMDIDSYHPHYERLKSIEKQIKGGVNLTRQLLGCASKGRYEVKPTNLNQIVEETSKTFGRTRKQIAIHRNMTEDLFAIEADRGQIEQVLLNLFINASDSMPGGEDLYLETNNVTNKDMKSRPYKSKAGNYVKLTVRDTGKGMDKITKERIFDPFFTTKEMGRGTGLGLASVYGIIKAHGGYIDVESKMNQGTTFEIYLPSTTKKADRVTKDSEKLIKQSGTVLLVDDEVAVRKVCMSILEKIGYRVLSAKDGEEVLELYRNNKDEIDIVLLDMIMPNMSGSEIYDRLKEINPEVKVLLSSGYSIDGEATEILNRGCDGFIQKPFNIKKLSEKLGAILNHK